jgi:cytochrome c nitrite reductase small subunit
MRKFIKKTIGWVFRVSKKSVLVFSMGFIFALLCFVILNLAMKPVSESKFCGNNCHEMHSALTTWKSSVHGENKTGLQAQCVDCHLPEKDDYFRHLVAKAYQGSKHIYRHYVANLFGSKGVSPKADVRASDRTDRMKNEVCIRCHASLLGKPSNETIREAHMEAFSSSGDSEQTKCVECHEDAGHKQ